MPSFIHSFRDQGSGIERLSAGWDPHQTAKQGAWFGMGYGLQVRGFTVFVVDGSHWIFCGFTISVVTYRSTVICHVAKTNSV